MAIMLVASLLIFRRQLRLIIEGALAAAVPINVGLRKSDYTVITLLNCLKITVLSPTLASSVKTPIFIAIYSWCYFY